MKIYAKVIAMVKSVCALSRKVQRYDRDLARQMRRACTSVPLNMVEGWHAVGGNRTARFNTAICEARETISCLDVSVACGYLSQAEVLEDLDRLDHIVAVCWRLSRARK
jgi:four helix bundle protein